MTSFCFGITCLFLLQCVTSNDEYSSDFIDPNQMFQEDINKNLTQTPSDDQNDVMVTSRYTELHRQLVQTFWNHMKDLVQSSHLDYAPAIVYATFSLDHKMIRAVHRYLHAQSDNPEEVNSFLTEMIVNMSTENPFRLPNTDNSSSYCTTLFFIWLFTLLASIAVVFYWLFQANARGRVIMIVFGVLLTSILWDWVRLYKTEVAKRMNSLPKVCKPDHELYWSDLVYNTASFILPLPRNDHCFKHTRLMMTDPFWEITPMHAVAETLWKFLFHPLSLFGDAFGGLFKDLLNHVPFYLIPFLFVGIILCLLAFCTIIRGYSFRIPLFLHIEAPAPLPQIVKQPNLAEMIHSLSEKDKRHLLQQLGVEASPSGDTALNSLRDRSHSVDWLPLAQRSHANTGHTLCNRGRHQWRQSFRRAQYKQTTEPPS